MKKQLILSIPGMLALAFCVLSCNASLYNNPLIGYWRSEGTYQSTIQSTSYNMYDIYIFRQNKFFNFGTTSLAHITQTNYDDDEFFANAWKTYIIDTDRIIVDLGESDGYQFRKIIPFYFSGAKLILTLPQSDADRMGMANRSVKYIRIE